MPTPLVASRLLAAPILAMALGGLAPTEPYESLPALEASEFLAPDLIEGPNHRVDPKAVSDDIFVRYTLTSPLGTFSAESTPLAAVRIREIRAIAELKKVDRLGVAAGATVDSLAAMGTGAFHAVTNPVETVKGIGDGIGRLFGQIGRGADRAKEQVEKKSTPKPGEPTPTTGRQAVRAGAGVASEVLGVTPAMRRWAKKLQIDPYTRNAVLRKELSEVATYDAAGRFARVIIPLGVVGSVLGTTAVVNDLVWSKDPDELVTLNESRLKALGMTPKQSSDFRLSPFYNLTSQTYVVSALDSLNGVPGRSAFLARAATAETEAEARFYVDSALMMQLFDRSDPILSISEDLPGACVSGKSGRFVCLYAFDYLVWTEDVAVEIDRITARARAEHPRAERRIWLTGRASGRSTRELSARGWTLRESVNVIAAPAPVSTPTAPAKSNRARERSR